MGAVRHVFHGTSHNRFERRRCVLIGQQVTIASGMVVVLVRTQNRVDCNFGLARELRVVRIANELHLRQS